MSVCTQAIVAAMSAVAPVMAPTMASAVGFAAKMKCVRATRYTPAVTIVAAWMSALTGVGPSMASGSQTCSGSCADLAAQARKSSSVMAISIGSLTPKGVGAGVVVLGPLKRMVL